MKLFGYWRSSATYRVRIALALKGLEYEYEAVNLLNDEQSAPAYAERNPLRLVPTLVVADGAISQSQAIIEYLDEAFPEQALLPADATLRAQARAFAATLACEAQPFMNLRIQRYLKQEGGFDDKAMADWLGRWPGGAMRAAEDMLDASRGAFCFGDEPGFAECFLVPQMFAASRFGIDLTPLKLLRAINERCLALAEFQKAAPENQPDAAPA